MQMTNHTLTPIVKGRKCQNLKKWLDDLKESLEREGKQQIPGIYAGGTSVNLLIK